MLRPLWCCEDMKFYGAGKIAQRSSSLPLSHLHLCTKKYIINLSLIHKLRTAVYQQTPFLGELSAALFKTGYSQTIRRFNLIFQRCMNKLPQTEMEQQQTGTCEWEVNATSPLSCCTLILVPQAPTAHLPGSNSDK